MGFNETSTLWDFDYGAEPNENDTNLLVNLTYQACQLRLNSRTVAALILFTIIFCLSVVGNSMVIVTIVQNRWMRTVTNIFLLNLAISDLLLTLICMPPTLMGILFKCFLWGPIVCKVIAYMQPVSVAACSFTLVVIALERYNAICRPLHSRQWKTKKHALFMMCLVWGLSFGCTLPSAVSAQLLQISPARFNCREWPDEGSHIIYISYLTFCLLLLPLIFMTGLYCLVINTLRRGIQVDFIGGVTADGDTTTGNDEAELSNKNKKNSKSKQAKLSQDSTDESKKVMSKSQFSNLSCVSSTNTRSTSVQSSATTNSPRGSQNSPRSSQQTSAKVFKRIPTNESRTNSEKPILRSTHTEQNLTSKKRVIKMLAAIVAEFFICWTPLYTYHLYLLTYKELYDENLVVTFLTLAYLSVCTNPVTYCFMNGKFRNAFLMAFGCRFLVKNAYQYTRSSVPTLMLAAKRNFVEEKRRLSVRRNAAYQGFLQHTETRNGFENWAPNTASVKKSLTVKLHSPQSKKKTTCNEIASSNHETAL